MLSIVIDLHSSNEIAMVFDNVRGLGGQLAHEVDLLQHVVVLVIVFDLDLFEGA